VLQRSAVPLTPERKSGDQHSDDSPVTSIRTIVAPPFSSPRWRRRAGSAVRWCLARPRYEIAAFDSITC